MFKFLVLASLITSLNLQAAPIELKDFRWKVDDIAEQNLKKEELFKEMNRSLVRLNDSICSNRAQVWAYDFKRHHEIDTAKIFLFFTEKNGRTGRVSWWYHVSPIVNENSKLWVMDAGFPHKIKTPLPVSTWLKEFTREDRCKEIRVGENELIERIYHERVFPQWTEYGNYNCYYIISPASYWTPGMLAKNMLGKDEQGRATNFSRERIMDNEVYQACLEVSTSPIGYALGEGHRICRAYMD